MKVFWFFLYQVVHVLNENIYNSMNFILLSFETHLITEYLLFGLNYEIHYEFPLK